MSLAEPLQYSEGPLVRGCRKAYSSERSGLVPQAIRQVLSRTAAVRVISLVQLPTNNHFLLPGHS